MASRIRGSIDGYAAELDLWFDDHAIPRRPRPDISEKPGHRSDWHRRFAREKKTLEIDLGVPCPSASAPSMVRTPVRAPREITLSQ